MSVGAVPLQSTHPEHARRPLSKGTARFGVATLACLTGLGVLFGSLSYRFLRGSQIVPNQDPARSADGTFVGIGYPGDFVRQLGPMVALIALAILITVLVFLPWINGASHAAKTERFPQHGAGPRDGLSFFDLLFHYSHRPVLAQVFAVVALRLGRASRAAGANTLFGLVSDTAMNASYDPATNRSEIGPIKIAAWWLLHHP